MDTLQNKSLRIYAIRQFWHTANSVQQVVWRQTESLEDWDNLLLEDEWQGHQAAGHGLDNLVNH